MKRMLFVLLSMTMLFSLTACGQQQKQAADTGGGESTALSPSPAPSVSQPSADEEINRAVELGLAPEDFADNADKTVTYAEFCAMLSNVIQKRYGAEYLTKWNEAASLALASDTPMRRDDGAMAIFEAALAVGTDDYHSASGKLPNIDALTGGEGIAGIRERDDWALFPNWKEPYFNINYEEQYDTLASGAANYPSFRRSAVSGLPIMDYDENLSMHFSDPFTRAQAVRAALRLYESWTSRDYVKPDDTRAAAFNPSIITDELLRAPSRLPEVTSQKLPSSWRGLCIYSKGVTHYNIIEPFRERDLRFLSENGFNFARVYLGFTTLGYPDHPEGGAFVNLAELEDLDRLIAWGLQYDIHISLCMLTPPGYPTQEDVQHQAINDNDYPAPEQWKLIEDYWVMLARRYAEIPNKNLSFELCCEWHLEERAAEFKPDWEPVIAAIRAITPDRVLLASFDTALPIKLRLAEDMASMGVALASHPYSPYQIMRGTTQTRAALGFTGELSWPLVWFPSEDFNRRNLPVTIGGAVGGTTLSVFVLNDGMAWEDESGKPSITVYADGKPCGTHIFTEGGGQDGLTAEIPVGTGEVTIVHTGGYLELACIRMDGPFGSAQIMPHDAGWSSNYAGEAKLTLGTDGKWSDAGGRLYDSGEFYKEELLPYIELAKRYHVGFMVNEFAFADDEQDTKDPIPLDAQLAHYSDAIRVFKDHDIGCALNFVSHSTGIIWDSPDCFTMWAKYPDYKAEQSYTYAGGRTDTFYVNQILLDTIKNALK